MNNMPKTANSLSTLLGQYMSDSDNDDEDQSKTSAATINCTISFESKSATQNPSKRLPTTYWTECLDKTTGHPYYWNTDTKEVTWDKPAEYVEYLKYMKTAYTVLPEDSWSIGYSDDAQTPYYVNEITRFVSWEKPANFKEKKQDSAELPISTKASTLTSAKKRLEKKFPTKKPVKKTLPKHLHSNSDDDEKIELISTYGSSSDDEEGEEKTVQVNLVAAYATDDSDGGNAESSQRQIIGLKKNKSGAIIETITIEADIKRQIVCADSPPKVPALNINANSFASIITGGKTNDSAMDEELNKFKEELEKELAEADGAFTAQTAEVTEHNFDEKTFQRKRRIEFKPKSAEGQRNPEQQRAGLGYTDSEPDGATASTSSKQKYIGFKKSHVEFEHVLSSSEERTYGLKDLSPGSESFELSSSDKKEDTRPECKTEIDDLCDVISGKVKFLSVGKPDVSAVQIMSIQLETLQAAFRASCLDSDYFFKWLKTTSDDLLTLEQHAAPDGWECKWDRENSQYCYKNLTTNTMQWNFPYDNVQEEENLNLTTSTFEPEVIREDDEMDISTTPPPPSPPIISGHAITWDQDVSTTKPDQLEATTDLSSRPNDITDELVSFYSDLATLEPGVSTPTPAEVDSQDKSNDGTKRTGEEVVPKKLKKRKKVKVPGLGSKMQEVSSMVANWQKAQKELGS